MKTRKRKQHSVTVADLIDVLPFYVMLVDEHHHILQANAAVRQHLGVDPEAIIGGYCPEVIHGIKEPVNECPLEEALEKGQAVERELLDEASGRWIRSAVYPIPGQKTGEGKVFFHMISDVSDRKRAEGELQASQAVLRDLCAHLESIREEERGRIAREVHDELGQILTSLNIDLSWLSQKMPGDHSEFLEKTRSMRESLGVALQAVKTISAELRPLVLDTLGLTAALEWQIQELRKRTGLHLSFSASPSDLVLDKDRSTALFRICQEALTNVIRHAGASSVRLTLALKKDRIVLSIQDNGKGIEPEKVSAQRSFGLIGMRERALHWGGGVTIRGRPGKGTLVRVSLPLAAGELRRA
jgi:PAS domain S-box-containing protein